MSELRYWLWLSALTGVRPRVKQELIGRYGGARELFFSPIDELKGDGLLTEEEREALSARRLDAALNIIERCEQDGIGILTIQDAAYPRRLAAIYDPPLVLYVRGRLPSIDDLAAVAVVGTRRATPYGLKMATRIGYELTRCGALVVSGLTSGVDAAAAEGALMAGGSCVGVLGSAIDDRRWGGSLARDVETVGAIVSEYPPGTPGNAAFFRARNRVTSGLTVACVVAEAPAKSGALLFADEALSQGREVFAVPANADAPAAAGSNALLKEGASPATDARDVLADFFARFPSLRDPGKAARTLPAERAMPEHEAAAAAPEKAPDAPEDGAGFAKLREPGRKKGIDKPPEPEYIDLKKQLEGLSEKQLGIVNCLSAGPVHIDDIIEKTGLPAAEALSELTLLQIGGYVRQEPGKRFSLNIIQK